jgi:hypothetical protein
MTVEEWQRDLEAAQRELERAKTVREIHGIQLRIKTIKGYISASVVIK